MPALVPDAELDALQRRVQGAARERMLREMVDAVGALCETAPLVLVLEDLHWSDVSTLDLLRRLAQSRPPARLCVITTYRPAEVIVHNAPLRDLAQELVAHRQGSELALTLLTAPRITEYLDHRFGRGQLPDASGQLLEQRTEGNPLFLVNVVDAWVAQGFVAQMDGRWQITTDLQALGERIPETLVQLIGQQVE